MPIIFKQLQSVETIDLSHCKISTQNLNKIFEYLIIKPNKLQLLYLNNIILQESTIQCLNRLLASDNCVITDIYMKSCNINNSLFSQLAIGLKQSRSLEVINLSYNKLQDSVIFILQKDIFLNRNNNCRYILDNNFINIEILQDFNIFQQQYQKQQQLQQSEIQDYQEIEQIIEPFQQTNLGLGSPKILSVQKQQQKRVHFDQNMNDTQQIQVQNSYEAPAVVIPSPTQNVYNQQQVQPLQQTQKQSILNAPKNEQQNNEQQLEIQKLKKQISMLQTKKDDYKSKLMSMTEANNIFKESYNQLVKLFEQKYQKSFTSKKTTQENVIDLMLYLAQNIQ